MFQILHELLLSWNLADFYANILARAAIGLAVIVLSFISGFLFDLVLFKLIKGFVKRTENQVDDLILESGFFKRLSLFAPLIILYFGQELVFVGMDAASFVIQKILSVVLIIISIYALDGLLGTVESLYNLLKVSKRTPIKGYIQLVKIFLVIIGLVFIVSTILNTSPWGILSSIGAMTAIILLVFKDSILGFVASVQLNANNMVEIGDWIEVPQYGADGAVIEITLTTIKVQNWDKTISTIPTYALISGSFKNWRGMQETKGRRIMRSIYIDMTSIRFCDQALLQKLKQIDLLRPLLEKRLEEIEAFNRSRNVDPATPFNGRALTNIGIFRAYLLEYLQKSHYIRQDLTLLVRQKQPGEHGVPIEIYCFTNDTRWAFYENIQSDIFDHIFAVLPLFDLKVFQYPSGSDITGLLEDLKSN